MRRLSGWLLMALVGLLVYSAPARAITLGQVDDFQTGTDLWGGGGVAGTPSGGPAGAADLFLQIASGSFGGNVRLATFNDSQWLGDYTAGVTGISVELKNFGSSDIPIRAVIRESNGSQGTPGYASLPFTLPADGQWHQTTFSLTDGMTGFNSPDTLANDLANVGDFRILSSASPSGIGDVLDAEIGIDDVTAVPEPSALALIATGLACGAWCAKYRR